MKRTKVGNDESHTTFDWLFAAAAIFSIGLLTSTAHAGTVVRLTTNYAPEGGTVNYFDVELYDDDAPITVTNFLQYVNEGLYDGTIIHRSVEDFVIQGGGFAPTTEDGSITALDAITNYGTIENEFSADHSNIYGTIAMAKVGGDPDSATNQWFINVADNSESLDSVNGGYTVFGEVIGEGMTLVNAINSLPPTDLTDYFGDTFSEVPLFNDASQLVTIASAAVVSPTPDPLPPSTYTGEISGVAYVDSNQNGIMDGEDYAIADAIVTLTQVGGTAPLATVYTGSDGSYTFSNLGYGPYSVKIESTCGLPGQDAGSGHSILDKDGLIINVGGSATAEQDGYGKRRARRWATGHQSEYRPGGLSGPVAFGPTVDELESRPLQDEVRRRTKLQHHRRFNPGTRLCSGESNRHDDLDGCQHRRRGQRAFGHVAWDHERQV